MRSPRTVGRLVAAQPLFEFVDAREQLAREDGTGVVQCEIAAEARGARKARGSVARKARHGIGADLRLEQSELHEARDELGVQSRLASEHVDLDERGRAPRPTNERGPAAPRRRRHQRPLRGWKCDTEASCSNSSRSSSLNVLGTRILTTA